MGEFPERQASRASFLYIWKWELSFIAAFLLGIFVVVFFKVAFAIFFVFALLFAMVWCLADSDIEIRSRKASDAEIAKEPLNKVDENGDSTPIQ